MDHPNIFALKLPFCMTNKLPWVNGRRNNSAPPERPTLKNIPHYVIRVKLKWPRMGKSLAFFANGACVQINRNLQRLRPYSYVDKYTRIVPRNVFEPPTPCILSHFHCTLCQALRGQEKHQPPNITLKWGIAASPNRSLPDTNLGGTGKEGENAVRQVAREVRDGHRHTMGG